MGNQYTFWGGNSVKIDFTSLLKGSTLNGKICKFFPFRIDSFSEGKGVYSRGKEFAPLGNKFFPFRVDTFSEGT